jgi:hypothetical protein
VVDATDQSRDDDDGYAPRLKLSDHLRRTSNQLQRLGSALATAKPRIDKRSPVLDSSAQADTSAQEALLLARVLVDQAKHSYLAKHPDAGWARLHGALELEVLAYSSKEVAATAVALKREVVDGNISGWEAKAIRRLLKEVNRKQATNDESAREFLRQAMKVRNDYFNSAYYVERIVAQRRLWLAGLGIALLIAALVLGVLILDDEDGVDYKDLRVPLLSATAGMIGAVTSAIQRLVAHPATAAPTDIGSFTAVLVRPFIGAVAALSVYLAVLGDFVRFWGEGAAPVALLILASFGVGFAERLVVYHPPQAVASPSSTK